MFFTFLNTFFVFVVKVENFTKNERGDIMVIWNLNLLSQLLKSNPTILLEHIDEIKSLITWYRTTVNMKCIQHLMNCYNCLIASLTNIYPIESSSFVYSLNYENDKEFFSKHLPIRV